MPWVLCETALSPGVRLLGDPKIRVWIPFAKVSQQ